MLKKSLSAAVSAALILACTPLTAVQAVAANVQGGPRLGAVPTVSVNAALPALPGALPTGASIATLPSSSLKSLPSAAPSAAAAVSAPAAAAAASANAAAPSAAAAAPAPAATPIAAAVGAVNAPKASAETGSAALSSLYEGSRSQAAPSADLPVAANVAARGSVLAPASARSEAKADLAVERRSDGGSLIGIGVGAAAVVTVAAILSKPFRALLQRAWNATLGILGVGVKKMETPEVMAQRIIDQLNAAKPVYNRKVQDASTMVEKLKLQIESEKAKVADLEKSITAILSDSDPNNDVLAEGMLKQQKILQGSIDASQQQLTLAESTLAAIKDERARFFAEREETIAKINAKLTQAKAAEIRKQIADLKGGFQIGDLKDNLDKFDQAVDDKVAEANGAQDSVDSNPDEIIKKAKDSLKDKEVQDELARRKAEIAAKNGGNGKAGGKLAKVDFLYFGAMGLMMGVMLAVHAPIVGPALLAAFTVGINVYAAKKGLRQSNDLAAHENRAVAVGMALNVLWVGATGVFAIVPLIGAAISIAASVWHSRRQKALDEKNPKNDDGGLIAEVGIGAAALVFLGAVLSKDFRNLLARAWNAALGMLGIGVKKMETPEVMAQRIIDQLNAAKPVYNQKVADASTLVERLKLQIQSQEQKSAELDKTITALLSQGGAQQETAAASMLKQKQTLDASTAASKEQLALAQTALEHIKDERARFFAEREETIAKINAKLTQAKAAEIRKQIADLKGGFQIGDLKDNMDKFEQAVDDKVAEANGAQDSVDSNPDQIIKNAKDQLADQEIKDELARRKAEIAAKNGGNGKAGGMVARGSIVKGLIVYALGAGFIAAVMGIVPGLAIANANLLLGLRILGVLSVWAGMDGIENGRNLSTIRATLMVATGLVTIAAAAGLFAPLGGLTALLLGLTGFFYTLRGIQRFASNGSDGGQVTSFASVWRFLNNRLPFGKYRAYVQDGRIVRYYGWSLSGHTFFQSLVLGLAAGPIMGLVFGSGLLWGIGGMAAAPVIVDLLKPMIVYTNDKPNDGGQLNVKWGLVLTGFVGFGFMLGALPLLAIPFALALGSLTFSRRLTQQDGAHLAFRGVMAASGIGMAASLALIALTTPLAIPLLCWAAPAIALGFAAAHHLAAHKSDDGGAVAGGIGSLAKRFWNALLGIFGLGVKKMETPEVMAQRIIDQLNAAKPVYNRKVQDASTMVEKLKLQISSEKAKVDDLEKSITAILSDSDPNNDVLAEGMLKQQKILQGSIDSTTEQLKLAETTLQNIKDERARFFAEREETIAKINAKLTQAKAAEIRKQIADLKGGFQIGDLKDNMDKFEQAVDDKVAEANGAQDSVDSNPDEIIKKAKDSLKDKEVQDELARRKAEIAAKNASNGKTGGQLSPVGTFAKLIGIGFALYAPFLSSVVFGVMGLIALIMVPTQAQKLGRSLAVIGLGTLGAGAAAMMVGAKLGLAVGAFGSGIGFVVPGVLALAAGLLAAWRAHQAHAAIAGSVTVPTSAPSAPVTIPTPAPAGQETQPSASSSSGGKLSLKPAADLAKRFWNALLGIFGLGVKKMETPEVMAQRLIDQLNAAKPVYNQKVAQASTLVEKLKLQVAAQSSKAAELDKTITALLAAGGEKNETLAASALKQKQVLDASTAATSEQLAAAQTSLANIKEERARFFADREEALAKINAGLTKAKAAEMRKQMADLKGGFQIGDLKDNMDRFEDAVNDRVAGASGAEDSVASNPDEIIKQAKDSMRDADIAAEIARRKAEIAAKSGK